MVSYYILFDSHEQAVKLHGQLREVGLETAIAPTPRQVSVCCGVSLLVREEKMKSVSTYLAEHPCVYRSVERIEQELNPRRDMYC